MQVHPDDILAANQGDSVPVEVNRISGTTPQKYGGWLCLPQVSLKHQWERAWSRSGNCQCRKKKQPGAFVHSNIPIGAVCTRL